MTQIPYLTLTLCQQGGIGYPPIIVKLDRWYAVSDSREGRPSKLLEPYLRQQRMWRGSYDHTPTRYWHKQEWVLRKWGLAPKLTWAEILIRVLAKEVGGWPS